MEKQLNLMKSKYLNNGKITKDDMDEAKIYKTSQLRLTPNDERSLHLQRAVGMNSDRIVDDYRNYINQKQQVKQNRQEKAANKASERAEMKARAEYLNGAKEAYTNWFQPLN